MADFAPVGVEAVVQGLGSFNRDIDNMNKKIGGVETTGNKSVKVSQGWGARQRARLLLLVGPL